MFQFILEMREFIYIKSLHRPYNQNLNSRNGFVNLLKIRIEIMRFLNLTFM